MELRTTSVVSVRRLGAAALCALAACAPGTSSEVADAAAEEPDTGGGDPSIGARDSSAPEAAADSAWNPSPDAPPTAPGVAAPVPWGGIGVGYYGMCLVLAGSQKVQCYNRGDPMPAGFKAMLVAQGHVHYCAVAPPGSARRVVCLPEAFYSFYPNPPATLALDPVQLSAGDTHTCALNRDGSVACWGEDASKSRPPAGLKAIQIAACGQFTCAIKPDHSVVCWGLKPAPPPTGLAALQISVANDASNRIHADPLLENTSRFGCAVTMDGAVVCWGDNESGQTDVPAGLEARQVVAGADSGGRACALLIDGTIKCWGRSNNPIAPPQGVRAKAIAGASNYFCALLEDDTVSCTASGNPVVKNVKVHVP